MLTELLILTTTGVPFTLQEMNMSSGLHMYVYIVGIAMVRLVV